MGEYEQTVEGWIELMLAEQLLETLPKPTQTFLAEQGAERLDTMVVLAERYFKAHGDPVMSKQKPQSPQQKHTPAQINSRNQSWQLSSPFCKLLYS